MKVKEWGKNTGEDRTRRREDAGEIHEKNDGDTEKIRDRDEHEHR